MLNGNGNGNGDGNINNIYARSSKCSLHASEGGVCLILIVGALLLRIACDTTQLLLRAQRHAPHLLCTI